MHCVTRLVSEGYVVDTDANVIICANAVEDKILGRIDEKGKVCITNPKVRYQLKTASMIKNPNCPYSRRKISQEQEIYCLVELLIYIGL